MHLNVRILAVAAALSFMPDALRSAPYRDGDTVVFLGDSITHGGLYHAYLTDFYRTRYPDADIRFVNSGIGGDNAGDARRRIPEDVAAYAPTHVAVHFGMNDVGRGWYRALSTDESLIGRAACLSRYRANLSDLIAEIRRVAPQAKLLCLTPTHYDDTAVITNAPPNWKGWQSVNQVGCNVALSLMAGHVLTMAKREGFDALNWHSLMSNFIAARRADDPSLMTTAIDRVHPGPLGHALMAWAFLKHQGVSPVVSDVVIDAQAGRASSIVNATVTDVSVGKGGGITFDLLAKSIPFPVPEEALPFVGAFEVERDLNRETVTVTGLDRGRYALKIDGETVGTYAAEELGAGVWLGFNAKTPQYRQAQTVFARVEELRLKERELRNHHSARWFFAKQAPVDDVAAFAAWFEKNEREADAYFRTFIPGYLAYWPRHDEIRAALWAEQRAVRQLAQPVRRHYEIVPMTSAADLEAGFRAPPDAAKPQVWWHWMAGNVTRAGITADLEAMAEAGIGGAILFDAGLGTRWGVPEGTLAFNTPEWYAAVKFAAEEAKRLGLELGMANCSGWANSGGPWNTPYYAMKTVCFTATAVKGGGTVKVALPQPEDKVGFYRDIAVVAFPTPAEPFELKDWKFKCFSDPGRKYDVADTRVAPAAAVVRREEVRALTADFADGTLACTLPPGDWTVLRVGYRALDRQNGTGTRLGKGLECDKLSKEALRIHWANYVEKTVKALGPGLAGPNGPLRTVLNDSYEVGTQNWTHGFERTFAEHAGYAITPWLPALCGRVVGSVAETEHFYRDFRLAVTDAFAANYAGEMRRLAHACGLQLAIEPYGEIPSDDLLYGEHADIPTAEFWAKLDSPHWVRQAASIAHAKGRRLVAAESFTTNAQEGRWQNTPWSMKAKCDWVYSEGLNRIIYHRFAHQPWTSPVRLPGMTMGPFGVHFDRTQTWWNQAKPWLKYQQRCQFLLQEGAFVCDVAWYCPAGYLYINWGHNPHKMPVPVPTGFTYDFVSDTTLAEMRVENGELVLPSGQRYRTLVLPEQAFELLPASRAGVARLKAAGAEILTFEEAKGVLAARAPDVAWNDRAAKLNWIHRRDAGADWYFVASPRETPCRVDVSFRVAGRVPELWNPETGEVTKGVPYAAKDGVTTVRIPFEPCASWFVVFRAPETSAPPSALPPAPAFDELTPLKVACGATEVTRRDVTGPWTLAFPVDWYVGGLAVKTLELSALADWTTFDDPDLKFFSGTATYRKTLAVTPPAAGTRLFLDLGDVKHFADVTVNGRACPTLWKPPFRVDVTDAAASGRLELVVRVTNLWPNRLIGDDFKPEDCTFDSAAPLMQRHLNGWPSFIRENRPSPSGKVTFATWKHWTKDDAPLPSGLLGPVSLLTVR